MENKKNHLTPLTARFPDDVFKRLKAHAEEQGISMSAATCQAVELSLDRALMLDRFELLTLQVAGNAARLVEEAETRLDAAISDAREVIGEVVQHFAEQAGQQKNVIERLALLADRDPPTTSKASMPPPARQGGVPSSRIDTSW